MRNTFLVALGLWLALGSYVHAQLKTADKQALLDLHNARRGSVGGANILQSVSGVLSVIIIESNTLCTGVGPRTSCNCTVLCRGMSRGPQSLGHHGSEGTQGGEPRLLTAPGVALGKFGDVLGSLAE